MNTPSSENRSSGPMREHESHATHGVGVEHHFLTWGILGGSALLAVLIVARMWSSYVPEMHRFRADRALRDGRPRDAISHLTALSELNRPDDVWKCLKELGDAYLDVNEPGKALNAFEQSLLKNGGQNLDEKFGICYARMGQKAKALEYFEKVLKGRPNSPAAHFFMGVYALDEKRFDQAGRHFFLAGGDPRWDREAVTYRERLEKEALGMHDAEFPATSTQTTSTTMSR